MDAVLWCALRDDARDVGCDDGRDDDSVRRADGPPLCGDARSRGSRRFAVLATLAVLGGYLAAWSAYAAAAALAQWWLFRSVLLDPRTLSVSPLAGGVMLVAAGAFQLSPMKGRCLAHCRGPLVSAIAEGRAGLFGALRVGFKQGVFCVGCCWLLMALLFAVGVMNALWGAALTGFVLAERVLPWRRAVVWFGAGACAAAGLGLMARAVLGG